MSLSSHLTELKKKHEHLSFEVEEMEKSPATDPLKVAMLKKKKLQLRTKYRVSWTPDSGPC